MAEFWSLVKLLPELIKLGRELFQWLEKASGGDPKGFIKKTGVAFRKLNEAKNQDERIAAARAISDLFNKL